jgi:hypothetical protein
MNRIATMVVFLGSLVGVLILAGQAWLISSLTAANSPAKRTPGVATATAISCSPIEELATHYHVALFLHRNGGVGVLPAGTGIEATCLYWIHVHDDSGIVHIEAPAGYRDHVFVLADAFAVAGMRLDAHHIGSNSYPGRDVTDYVDGKRWAGNPGAVQLVDTETIDVVAPGQPYTYTPFKWPPGFVSPPTY